jgi:hypothetical protein
MIAKNNRYNIIAYLNIFQETFGDRLLDIATINLRIPTWAAGINQLTESEEFCFQKLAAKIAAL